MALFEKVLTSLKMSCRGWKHMFRTLSVREFTRLVFVPLKNIIWRYRIIVFIAMYASIIIAMIEIPTKVNKVKTFAVENTLEVANKLAEEFVPKPVVHDSRVMVDPEVLADVTSKLTITIDFEGRLGNSMFQFAFVYVMSRKFNLRIALKPGPALEQLQETFDYDFSQYVYDWPVQVFTEHFTSVLNKYDCALDTEIFLKPKTNTHYRGYYQSWKYYSSFEEDLKSIFTLKKGLFNWAQKSLRSILRHLDERDPSQVLILYIN